MLSVREVCAQIAQQIMVDSQEEHLSDSDPLFLHLGEVCCLRITETLTKDSVDTHLL
jgi:hypothetical protein